jgi:hypothetical protein
MILANTVTSLQPRQAAPHAILQFQTDLSILRGKSIQVFLDEQNLSISARELGYCLDYVRLTRLLRSLARIADLHIFIASARKSLNTGRALKRFGHAVHVKNIRTIPLRGGQFRRDSNIDNLFAFWVGTCAAGPAHEIIVLGSGDYGLSGELAAAIVARGVRTEVVTLSLPGSTARDLDASRNPNIRANIQIGLDVLRPRSHSLPAFRLDRAMPFCTAPERQRSPEANQVPGGWSP